MIPCLLVTGDPQVRDCVRVGLAQTGSFEVDVCEDGWAVEMSRARPYQVVIADTTLGDGGDGLDLLRQVRHVLPNAELLLVARGKGESRYLAKDKQELGIYAFLQVPVEPLEFFRTAARLSQRLKQPAA